MTDTTEKGLTAIAREWHEMSDHAADGTPFGGGLCNCLSQAIRVERILAARASNGRVRTAARLAWRHAHNEACPQGDGCSAHQPIEARSGFDIWLDHLDLLAEVPRS